MSNPLDGALHYLSGTTTDGLLGPFGRVMERAFNAMSPNKFLTRGEYEELYLSGQMGDEDFQKLMLFEGYDVRTTHRQDLYIAELNLKDFKLDLRKSFTSEKVSYYTHWLRQNSWTPNEEQIILFLQRKWISTRLAHYWLLKHGVQDWDTRRVILEQINELPTAQDLIQFSVRHGFEPDILSTFGYAKEIPKTYLEWADKIGLGGKSGVIISDATDSTGQPLENHDASWAEQHWFAHWILPSLGDAYEMLHRLYPDSKYGPSPDFQPGLEFTPELLSLFQRAQDIPQYWRNRLQAISYLPLSRVDVRRMFNLRIIDEAQVYHSYRAQGYSDENSQNLLSYAKSARTQADLKNELWPKAEKICELYSLGVLDRGQVDTYTARLGIPREDVEDFLSNCELDKQLKRIKEALSVLKSGFMKGKINSEQVTVSLLELEVGQDAIDEYLSDWTMLQQNMEKEIAAKENQTWYEKGIIGKDEFISRLQNLGFNNVDILHMVQLADMAIAEQQAKIALKEVKETIAKQKEQKKEQANAEKELAKEQKDYLRNLLSASTQTNLKKWWKKKLIPKDLLEERLRLLNYSEDDISRWEEAWG